MMTLYSGHDAKRVSQSICAVVATITILVSPTCAQDVPSASSSFSTGLILDSPDDLRDVPQPPTFRAFLPEQVDLSRYFPVPGHQGKQGSCVAWAVGYAARAYYSSATERRSLSNASNIPSPAYIYNSIKAPGGCDTGSQIRKALELLVKGSLSAQQYPYSPNSCGPVTEAEKAEAKDFRIDSFQWIWDDRNRDKFLNDVKGQLAQNHPVVLSMRVTKAFHDLRAGQTYDRPTECADSDGCYHAVTAVGYDERRQAVKLINSWGPRWGDKGFGWIAYDTFKTEVRGAYVMRVSPPPPPPAPTCSLSVNPSLISQGGTATLFYTSQNTNVGSIDNGIGNVTVVGTKTISPSRTTVFTGTFSGTGGEAKCATTLEVTQPPDAKPIIARFSASPQNIDRGQSSVLSWSVTGATSVRIDGGIGIVTGGTVTVSPTTTTQFSLTATNAAGSTTETANVAVSQSLPFLLPSVDCGKVEIFGQGSKREVKGFVGSDNDLEKIRVAVSGTEIDVKVRPWPQCEALMTLEKALLRNDRPKVAIRRSTGDILMSGDRLVFEVQTPSFPSYVHVAYIQADGSVLNLVQPGEGSFVAYKPNSKIVIGDGEGGRRFRVSQPYGREMLIVLVGKSPTFPEPRPKQETEREFLTALRRALIAKPDPSAPDRDIVAAYDAIITKDRTAP